MYDMYGFIGTGECMSEELPVVYTRETPLATGDGEWCGVRACLLCAQIHPTVSCGGRVRAYYRSIGSTCTKVVQPYHPVVQRYRYMQL